MSGYTTTGATVLTDIEALPHGLLLWRTLTHFVGGMGVVVLYLTLFAGIGSGGLRLFQAEAAPGQSVGGRRLVPRVREAIRWLWGIYVGLHLVQIVLLCAGGMPLFDAFIHAFGTLATGGFSSHSESVLYYRSWRVELILVAFMFAAGINFAVYDTFLRQGFRGAWRVALHSSEIRAYAGIVVGATLIIAVSLWFWGGSNGDPESDLPNYSSLGKSLRDSLFTVVSVQTSTGYGTEDFNRWPDACRILLMVLAICGACAGSTGGGMKVVRFLILAKAALQGVRNFARPRAIHSVRLDGSSLPDGTVGMVMSYCGLWFLVFLLGTLIIAGLDLEPPAGFEDQVLLTAATSVLATLNNIGPGLAAVGPTSNFAFMPDPAKLLLSFFMILGRLEFYAVVILFVPRFWRS